MSAARKLSTAMARTLQDIAVHNDAFYSAKGRSQQGGRAQCLKALKMRGLINREDKLTLSGSVVAGLKPWGGK